MDQEQVLQFLNQIPLEFLAQYVQQRMQQEQNAQGMQAQEAAYNQGAMDQGVADQYAAEQGAMSQGNEQPMMSYGGRLRRSWLPYVDAYNVRPGGLFSK